ncbi:two-component system sensor histidine kinase NtrB [Desulfofustis glycolicus]|nr:ATP-binding protein [Desulfofustis glycolicus]
MAGKMGGDGSPKSNFFRSNLLFRPSKAAVGVLVATIVLAVVLALSTLQNINREQELMERFMLQKGETVVRAVRAALRTSMMHRMMGSGDALQTLLTESGRERDIAFIVLTDRDARVIAQTEDAPDVQTMVADVNVQGDADRLLSSLDEQAGLFIVSARLAGWGGYTRRSMMPMHRLHGYGETARLDGAIIAVGLYTEAFDEARRQDVRHAIFMGALLFLVGSAGLYALFVYQGMRVAKMTLANMKLYTDNIVGSIPLGIITLDKEQRVVSCNRIGEEIIGRSVEELRGRLLPEILPGCGGDAASSDMTDLDRRVDCEMADGRRLPLQIGRAPLHNTAGQEIGTVLVLRDMTLIRDMEQQLERSRRMAALGKMAAGIAHEIRNPLGTLRGFAHLFRTQEKVTEDNRKYAELMIGEVDRLNRTVSGLLQFARPREPSFEIVDLDELFARTFALLANDFAEHKLKAHRQQEVDIKVEADPDLLLQVLMNLLKNSVNATPAGGEVSLRAAADDRLVRIIVADTGSGVSDEDKERMFDPFFTTRKNGVGLGLAVSHQIVEQHHGTIEVRTAPGEGTEVEIQLPKKR